MPLVSGFSRGLPFTSPFQSGAAPYSPHFTLVGSRDLAVKSRPNIFTHSLKPWLSNHVQSSQKGSDFTSMQKHMEKRRWFQYVREISQSTALLRGGREFRRQLVVAHVPWNCTARNPRNMSSSSTPEGGEGVRPAASASGRRYHATLPAGRSAGERTRPDTWISNPRPLAREGGRSSGTLLRDTIHAAKRCFLLPELNKLRPLRRLGRVVFGLGFVGEREGDEGLTSLLPVPTAECSAYSRAPRLRISTPSPFPYQIQFFLSRHSRQRGHCVGAQLRQIPTLGKNVFLLLYVCTSSHTHALTCGPRRAMTYHPVNSRLPERGVGGHSPNKHRRKQEYRFEIRNGFCKRPGCWLLPVLPVTALHIHRSTNMTQGINCKNFCLMHTRVSEEILTDLNIEVLRADEGEQTRGDVTTATTNASIVRHTARERAELSSAKDFLKFTRSEYWDMAMATDASGGQAPFVLHASNVRVVQSVFANYLTFCKSCITSVYGGRGGRADSPLASHQGEPGSIPAGSPDFRKWKLCRTMPLVGGSSRGSPVSPTSSLRRYSIPQSPTSALKTSLLRATQISSPVLT
ncbi:hypothetical protein PR048_026025 [Dryococelus australis]|uniref:Uncharacterized protein n=1 Tax=Dryococelus australis TaxID=614101 RepID=A0ABQ9GK56_9NEOP|nr:hypothetical protein PR048_026025 [Dryococelus australis]